MGQKFGKYELLNRLAVGGMAEIFVARSEGMEGFSKTIVIKRIRPHLSRQASFVTLFLNEAKVAAQLNHSSIVQIFDLGRIRDSYFIAMEYVEGRDMRAIVQKTQERSIAFPMEYALKVASEACEGLYYAHRKQDGAGKPLSIVHRDITPENIMVSFNGEVKLLDFGIAKAENMVSETRPGEIKGKLGYLSPEQVGGREVDHRSDLFSLGVVLYEWLTGQRLFGGQTDAEVLHHILDAKIFSPSYFKDDIPKPVEAIVLRALERNPPERYQTAWEMQYDIEKFFLGHEFNPSNIQLSNFLRQIFADELLAEEAGKNTPGASDAAVEQEGAPGEGPPATAAEATTSLKRQPTPADGSGSLSLRLLPDEIERLRKVAVRRGVSLEALLQEILQQFTKYL